MIELGIIMMLFMFPANLAMALTKLAKKPVKRKKTVTDSSGAKHTKIVEVRPKLTAGEVILSCLPCSSAMMVWKALYLRFGWTIIPSVLTTVAVVFRVIVIFLTQNTLLYIISFWLLWGSLLAMHIMYIVVYCVTAYLYSMKIFTIILCAVFPYGAAWYLHSNIPKLMREMDKEEDNIFKG